MVTIFQDDKRELFKRSFRNWAHAQAEYHSCTPCDIYHNIDQVKPELEDEWL